MEHLKKVVTILGSGRPNEEQDSEEETNEVEKVKTFSKPIADELKHLQDEPLFASTTMRSRTWHAGYPKDDDGDTLPQVMEDEDSLSSESAQSEGGNVGGYDYDDMFFDAVLWEGATSGGGSTTAFTLATSEEKAFAEFEEQYQRKELSRPFLNRFMEIFGFAEAEENEDLVSCISDLSQVTNGNVPFGLSRMITM